MKFERFAEHHYEDYKTWFENRRIKDALSHIDEEWLDFVFSDKSGAEYAVLDENLLVAVVGINFPEQDHPSMVITNIAVNPKLHRKGLGSSVLKELLKNIPLIEGQVWAAYVEKKNEVAIEFFKKNNWKEKSDKSTIDLVCFSYEN